LNGKYGLENDEYCIAALIIYCDILAAFVFIVALLGACK